MSLRRYRFISALLAAVLCGPPGWARSIEQNEPPLISHVPPGMAYIGQPIPIYARVTDQTGKVRNFPILLYGKDYWKPMLEQIDRMVAAGTLGQKELEFVFVADSVEEATRLLQGRLVLMWQQAQRRTDAPKWWFLEDQPKGEKPMGK